MIYWKGKEVRIVAASPDEDVCTIAFPSGKIRCVPIRELIGPCLKQEIRAAQRLTMFTEQ